MISNTFWFIMVVTQLKTLGISLIYYWKTIYKNHLSHLYKAQVAKMKRADKIDEFDYSKKPENMSAVMKYVMRCLQNGERITGFRSYMYMCMQMDNSVQQYLQCVMLFSGVSCHWLWKLSGMAIEDSLLLILIQTMHPYGYTLTQQTQSITALRTGALLRIISNA